MPTNIIKLPAHLLARLEQQHCQTSVFDEIDVFCKAFQIQLKKLKLSLRIHIALSSEEHVTANAPQKKLLNDLKSTSEATERVQQASQHGHMHRALGIMCNEIWPFVLGIEEQLATEIGSRGVLMPEFSALFDAVRAKKQQCDATAIHSPSN